MKIFSAILMLLVCLESANALDLQIVRVGNSRKTIAVSSYASILNFTKITQRRQLGGAQNLAGLCRRPPRRNLTHYIVQAKTLKSITHKRCSVSTATNNTIRSGKILTAVLAKQFKKYREKPVKKLIAFDVVPNTTTMLEQVQELEASNIDGVVFKIQFENRENKGFEYFAIDPTPMARAEFLQAAAELISAPLIRLQHNFLLVNARPGGDMNWFDDQWLDNVVQKMHHIGWVLRETNQRGIMFDPEEYQQPVWHVASLITANSHNYIEHCIKAQEWGYRITKALLEEYPDIRIMTPHPNIGFPTDSNIGYSGDPTLELWSWFLNGVAQAGLKREHLIITTENTYGATSVNDFVYYGDSIRSVARHNLLFKEFNNQAIYGFAVSPTGGNEYFNFSDYNQNYHTPERFRDMVREALKASDEYAWIYVRKITLWNFTPVLGVMPQSYKQAIKDARTANNMRVW